MIITCTWVIGPLETDQTHPELADVVKTIHWRRNATDGTYSATSYGTVSVGDPTPETFTDYVSLTEAQVIGWLEGSMDVAVVDADLTKMVEAMHYPPVLHKAVPWA